VPELHRIQREHEAWQRYNFGGNATGENSFLGMVEELGEMAHAMLKHKQGIRGKGDPDEAIELVIDAHCDLIIFSLGVANDLGYDLETRLDRVWEKVKRRDWVRFPLNGLNE
jgi:NTP pyrophosphatase (non-canonical NTP hydrolase)